MEYLDASGDDIFNTLDILVIIGNILFWFIFYKVVMKKTINYEKELSDTNIKYIKGSDLLKQLNDFESKLNK
tara:strand:+ start:772 stop:987 length:216 start_codon:yes stop_codon:yes gene_type:complete